jgi:peptidoglycan/xylan/chitin deacetylase (PgdA/CDA1 family)/TolA-binding protein
MKSKGWLLAAGAVLASGAVLVAALWFWWWREPAFHFDPSLNTALNGIVRDYRQVIVLVDGADMLDAAAHARAIAAGRILFWRKQNVLEDTGRRLTEEYQQAERSRFRRNANGVRQFIEYLNNGAGLRDADKLAFLDLVEELQAAVPQNAAGRYPMAASLAALRDELQSIQAAYREEVARIFSQFGTRGQTATREKWDDYLRFLKERLSRDAILGELRDSIPEEEPEGERGANDREIFGNEFPPKTVALTFDDGPHPLYTEQVLAILRKYGIKACFFELGMNLGAVDAGNQVKLGTTAAISRKVLEAGHVVANHTYSHRVLLKLSEEERMSEIDRTDRLLEAVSGQRPSLFRAPYGARNKGVLDQVTAAGLRSVMWTVDSLDWADPVPESIAMRVLHELNQRHRGIILFHDIHKQSVMALSPVIEELQREDYSFLGFENGEFTKSALPPAPERASAVAPAAGPEVKRSYYRESWAAIVGINDYQHWPKLRYAVNDANGVEEALVSRFGFKRDHIRKLIDGEATRERIMEILGDEFTNGKNVQREDRVFVFFAGHGATRTFEDGRQAGFIVPVDADPANYYATAISMTALREAADLIPAKHVYFVMDSCYSGLALTRSAGSFARDRTYLDEITRRTARQILTAGGAEQQVSDEGPDGHSVFTWALLQGLQGQADLDGNGVITASELGAYISPIVSQFAKQTPAVGNLVGSEGGEFLFELQPEPLTSMTKQLDGHGLQLTEQLSALQKEIAAKQEELLRLQQSIQAQSAKLGQMTRSGASTAQASAVTVAGASSKSARAYDLDRQGLQYYRQKQYELAEQKFRAAVQLKPQDPVLLNNLGFIYYVMGRNDEAVTYLEKTLVADPHRKEAQGNIAELYLRMGRREEARKHYEEYLALYPNSPKAEEFHKILATLN